MWSSFAFRGAFFFLFSFSSFSTSLGARSLSVTSLTTSTQLSPASQAGQHPSMGMMEPMPLRASVSVRKKCWDRQERWKAAVQAGVGQMAQMSCGGCSGVVQMWQDGGRERSARALETWGLLGR